MKIIGIICEYNPFHNGHIYHIKKIKEMFPNSLLILVLNGYFLERGEISILTKEDKTKLSLQYGIDLVVELPVIFGTQSADIFAKRAIEILNNFHVTDIVFGSESNDIDFLTNIAKSQLEATYNKRVKEILKTGVNYPTALSKALNLKNIINNPNDLLGISYAKAIIINNYPIKLHSIKRTNDYHNINSNERIISASNIRNKLQNNQDITFFIPKYSTKILKTINEDLLFKILKYKITTDNNLSLYLTVDEGIEKRLKKAILISENLQEFILNVKTKRYTYNKIRRMIIHILLGLTKEINNNIKIDYLHILGFNKKGQEYLKKISKTSSISFKPIYSSKIYEFEKRAAYLYELFSNSQVSFFELQNKPIIISKK